MGTAATVGKEGGPDKGGPHLCSGHESGKEPGVELTELWRRRGDGFTEMGETLYCHY